jgi:phage tail sheath protein FI
VVFEPNDDRLWARVIDTIRLFLRSEWRLGALFGRTEQEAFFITCDRTTMSQDDILNGRADLRDRHCAGTSGGVRDLPDLPAHG